MTVTGYSVSLSGYADDCAKQLARSASIPHFEGIISGIQRQLTEWKIEGDEREAFWRDVAERYAKAPKLRLDDTTAAANLFALQKIASQMLAAAAQRRK